MYAGWIGRINCTTHPKDGGNWVSHLLHIIFNAALHGNINSTRVDKLYRVKRSLFCVVYYRYKTYTLVVRLEHHSISKCVVYVCHSYIKSHQR